jgi:hypothetical protein
VKPIAERDWTLKNFGPNQVAFSPSHLNLHILLARIAVIRRLMITAQKD